MLKSYKVCDTLDGNKPKSSEYNILSSSYQADLSSNHLLKIEAWKIWSKFKIKQKKSDFVLYDRLNDNNAIKDECRAMTRVVLTADYTKMDHFDPTWGVFDLTDNGSLHIEFEYTNTEFSMCRGRQRCQGSFIDPDCIVVIAESK